MRKFLLAALGISIFDFSAVVANATAVSDSRETTRGFVQTRLEDTIKLTRTVSGPANLRMDIVGEVFSPGIGGPAAFYSAIAESSVGARSFYSYSAASLTSSISGNIIQSDADTTVYFKLDRFGGALHENVGIGVDILTYMNIGYGFGTQSYTSFNLYDATNTQLFSKCYFLGEGPTSCANPGSKTLEDNFKFTIYTNTEYSVRIVSFVEAKNFDLHGHSYYGPLGGYAYIDPYFYLDPSTPHPENFHLSFSRGFGNPTLRAIPEPKTWALMIMGFGLVGSMFRRKRTGVQTLQS